MSTHIINIANRLPVKIEQKITSSDGGLATAFVDIQEEYQLTWVGWPGKVTKDEEKRQSIKKELISKYNCHPVFLSEYEIKNFYHGFSNTSLWPLFHYFTAFYHYEKTWYKSYCDVNQKFADLILTLTKPDTIIWIHDYHLMLLPALLKKERPDLKIAFFLHTPFPSYEIFRRHSKRKELLRGLIASDLIGFHTYGYLRHFRSSVLRVLDIESDMDELMSPYSTKLGVFPIGISWQLFSRTMKSEKYKINLAKLERNYKNKKIVLGIERLDYTKGIPEKLDAIEKLLKSSPQLRDKIVFIQVIIPSREEVATNQQLLHEIRNRISIINGKYSTISNTPINFIYRSLTLDELTALYARADVGLIMPLMDGMNLVAKEFVACQNNENPGILILSEFAGSARELYNAVISNPYDSDKVAKSIAEALETPKEEAIKMNSAMKKVVCQKNSIYWAKDFLTALEKITLKKEEIKSSKQAILEQCRQKIISSPKTAIFLDYDGTLCPLGNDPKLTIPSQETIELLEKLQSHNNLDVYIISGRTEEDLNSFFPNSPLTLIAEHGLCYQLPGKDWTPIFDVQDSSWQKVIHEIMETYSLSTPGSYLEVKKTSLVWHYRRTDPDFGSWKAKQLLDDLYSCMNSTPLDVRHGNKIVEVSSQKIRKDKAILFFQKLNNYHFLMCAGDDVTDENMFRIKNIHMTSFKIGSGKTGASHCLESSEDLKQFLRELIRPWKT